MTWIWCHDLSHAEWSWQSARSHSERKLTENTAHFFFSKLFTDAEIWYWFMKLKIVCLIWTIKKICHMINEFLAGIMIWTDHFITIQIMRQMTLISSSMNKLNLHLVRALQYCSQFCIDVWHHSGQLNIVLNALSCLLNKIVDSKNWLLEDILENIDDFVSLRL